MNAERMVEDDATLTLTPEGVSEPDPTETTMPLARASSAELQSFDRAIRTYRGSENQLLNAAADLLAVYGTLSRMKPGEELHATRVELSRAIVDLKYRIVQLDYPPSVAENLCLLFAIVIDEFVMLSDWGRDSGWENRTLVADLFGFRDGGDRFYTIADRALMQPKALREFLQIVYIFLKLGYRGRYSRGAEHERDRLIGRLESSLDLMGSEPEIDRLGRDTYESKPPASLMPATRKVVFAVVVMIAITLLVVLSRGQVMASLERDFAEQAAAVAGQGPIEFIYSSETGTTERRTGQ